jgi:chemotaxis protein MotB
MAAKSAPIIVIKKTGGHAGHHGGAWKVAYADFVTAMMALFIVLWLMGSSEKVKKAVAGYFNDPKGTANLLGTTMAGNGVEVVQNDENKQRLAQLKQKLEEEIKAKKELEKLSSQIEITITAEGLRIEMLEGKNGTFFQSGSASLSSSGQELLALLAGELKTLPNDLLIEGHTDAAQYSTDANYSNWELSADRANAARRLLQGNGVRANQVTQVRAYADELLRNKANPYDPANRRITILVKNGAGGAPPLVSPLPNIALSPLKTPNPPSTAVPAKSPAPHPQPQTSPPAAPPAGQAVAKVKAAPSPAAGSGFASRLKAALHR